MRDAVSRAKNFIYGHGRLLERRIFDSIFDGGEKSSVLAALQAYQNGDGGLGHALEPDLRCPTSQPIFVEFGLSSLHAAGIQSLEFATTSAKFLASIAADNGLVPAIFASALDYDHADHWQGQAVQNPRLNPTLGLCGLLYYHGHSCPWLSLATDTCIEMLTSAPQRESHVLLGASHLASYIPDKNRSDEIMSIIGETLPHAEFFAGDAPTEDYALTPLHFAPHPTHPFRSLFSDNVIDIFLDDLLEKQQEDGGWPISWNPPKGSAALEWRALFTMNAIITLIGYGRIEA